MKYLSVSSSMTLTVVTVAVTITIAYNGSYRCFVSTVTHCNPDP